MNRLLALPLLAFSLAAPAADLSIALGGDVTSMDPHFHNLTPNNNIGAHVFETLVAKDAGGRHQPALAESWRAVD
ncbi:MAG: ABC transporter substrate-binding protein, partial [Burkholderiales bacterium]